MTKDLVNVAEGLHDQGLDVEPFLQEALDELIDRLFNGKKVGRFGLDAYVEQFSEEVASKVINGNLRQIGDLLETLIRRELSDSDELREAAAELANERPE